MFEINDLSPNVKWFYIDKIKDIRIADKLCEINPE